MLACWVRGELDVSYAALHSTPSTLMRVILLSSCTMVGWTSGICTQHHYTVLRLVLYLANTARTRASDASRTIPLTIKVHI